MTETHNFIILSFYDNICTHIFSVCLIIMAFLIVTLICLNMDFNCMVKKTCSSYERFEGENLLTNFKGAEFCDTE